MSDTTVTAGTYAVGRRSFDVRVPLAFFAIYVLWGTTYFAIRVAVLEIPPFFTAGVRFFTAGALLYVVMRLAGERAPSMAQWRNIAVTALCMFVATYGALFWAEQYVPSGVASLLEATLPIMTIALEVFVFRSQRLTRRMLIAAGLGFVGVAWLLAGKGESSFPLFPSAALLLACMAWSFGAVFTRSMSRPDSALMTAGAQMMLGGAVLLALSEITGELHPFPHVPLRAGLALLYLVVGGSLFGFTAYVWLLGRMPATRVASHAYVNPLVAVALGYFAGGEPLTAGMIFASVLIVASVFLILKPAVSRE
ncbi:MAG TPA: EamA family transporter [Rhizomicrobium sp.]|nr:EamA family transporter [Rhizomicrobium sp.]